MVITWAVGRPHPEGLHEQLEQTAGNTPTQRVLAAIGGKQGAPSADLAERHTVAETAIRYWLDRFAEQLLPGTLRRVAVGDGRRNSLGRPGTPFSTTRSSRRGDSATTVYGIWVDRRTGYFGIYLPIIW